MHPLKIVTVVGTRPNFMKAAPLDRAFAKMGRKDVVHSIVHTGQHYDDAMSGVFFRELGITPPAWNLGVGAGTQAAQTAQMLVSFDSFCEAERPDVVIVLGDVNSTLSCAIAAKKRGIVVAHVEGGLRSFDMSMPEEVNRRLVDSISDRAYVTERSAVDNLLREGWREEDVLLCGNTMIDSLLSALPSIEGRRPDAIPKDFGDGGWCVATLHRPANVDDPAVLAELFDTLREMSSLLPVIAPLHPRTLAAAKRNGIDASPTERLLFTPPMGYLEFLHAVSKARLVATDSGGIQEETTALDIPCLTVRPNTERPVTIELGTNILVRSGKKAILAAVRESLSNPKRRKAMPPFWDGKAAERIVIDILERGNP